MQPIIKKVDPGSMAEMSGLVPGDIVLSVHGVSGLSNFQVVEMLRAKYGDVPEKCEVTLPEIKKLGSYTAGVKLHPEVKATMKIDVVAQ